MRLIELSYESIKGRTEQIKLSAENFIHGRNFTGKTTIIDALKLLLLGFHPQLDKTARGIFELASGESMTVSGVFTSMSQDGQNAIATKIGRQWQRKGETVTKKDFLPMGWPETPVVLLDANEYFGKSDRGKVEMLFAAGRLKTEMKWERFQLPDLDQPEAAELRKVWNQSKSGQEAIDGMFNRCEEMRSEAAASAKRMEGTLQGLSALQQSEPEPPSADTTTKLLQARNEMEAAQTHLRDAERLRTTLEKSATPEEAKVSQAQNDIQNVCRLLEQKTEEKLKIEKRWKNLLDGDSKRKIFCAKCRVNAEKLRDGDLSAVSKSLTELEAERKKLDKFIVEERPKAEKSRNAGIKKSTDKVNAIEEKIAGLREEIAKLERDEKRYHAELNDRKRLAEAREERERYVQQESKLKEAKKFLLETKEQMVREMFGPISKTAEAFTRNILKWPLAFNGSELGYWKCALGMGGLLEVARTGKSEQQWVPHRVFSGTEQAIAFAALQAALAATAPVKILVLDELGRFDDDNKSQFLQNVSEALEAGVIDQAILIDTERPAIEPRGDWNYIERI